MKAISLHQPWATLVVRGWKTIETRTHERFKNLNGQTIAIHATKRFDSYHNCKTFLSGEQQMELDCIINSERFLTREFGSIIGIAFVEDFRMLGVHDSQAALIECMYTARFGLILKNPIILTNPIPYKGHQGIFNVPNDLFPKGLIEGIK